ncbi:mannose-1-phosphate guanylyltransferase [Brachybacterium sp. J153]|uniref:mannose-1-phosphate guanylyltransferase n=1 Tax=Brachybacterium sp. J153 TaxID=3116488 RepID=UPI002E77DD22|nr:mannose-1-phosphate guanylyltransferase [Brachybacterium sp. J153]MEE1616840.1 mannose-1-phosphate guanylyltransferase [Brachybacterium sp. J153]
MPSAPFVPVIPAGGSGTRLWPLSRRARPKFLLDLTGRGSSLLQQTLDRLAPLADHPPVVVTGTAHAAEVRAQLDAAGHASTRILAEPSPRNSMPAIALAAAVIEREHPDAVLGSFAADHLIADQEAFTAAVAIARKAAELGFLVTLGISPTGPETGFGYIQEADPGAEGTAARALRDLGARPVARFVEKPDRETAEGFLAEGGFSWNAGMFVVRARVMLDELAVRMPPLAAGVRELAAMLGTPGERAALDRLWPTLTAIAIDHALAEPLAAAGRVAVVPAAFGWDDVGDFAVLARQLRATGRSAAGTGTVTREGADGSDVQVLGGARVDAVSSRATVYGATDRHVALVGLDGISIVDTDDVLLVLADEHAQDLARLVAGLDGADAERLR